MHVVLAEQGDQTDDNTPLDSANFQVFPDTTYRLDFTAVARGKSPNTGRATFSRKALVSVDANLAILVDASSVLETVTNVAATGWTIAPAIVGNRIVLRVTGALAASVVWQTEIMGMSTSAP